MNKLAKLSRDYAFARSALLFGLALIVFGCFAWRPVIARQSYPQTEAVVSRTELYEDAYTENGTRHEATYRIYVRYSVDGNDYEEEYGVFPERPVGSSMTINYNPHDPHDIGQPNSVVLPIGFIAGGGVLLAAGVISFVKTRKKNQALKRQEEEWKHGG